MGKGLKRRGGGDRRCPFERKHIRVDGRSEAVLSVTCKYCGEESHIHAGGGRVGGRHLPPDMIAKKFQQKGWQVSMRSKAPRCPDCVSAGGNKLGTVRVSKILRDEILELIRHHPDGIKAIILNQFMGRPDTSRSRDILRKILRRMFETGALARTGKPRHYSYLLPGNEPIVQERPVDIAVVASAMSPARQKIKDLHLNDDKPEEEETMSKTVELLRGKNQPSHAGAKAQRVMMQLLDAHFDEEGGHYTPGWSDVKVAQEVELSETFVARFREDAYGALKEPEEFAELRGEIDALKEMCTTECKRLQERLSEVRQKYG